MFASVFALLAAVNLPPASDGGAPLPGEPAATRVGAGAQSPSSELDWAAPEPPGPVHPGLRVARLLGEAVLASGLSFGLGYLSYVGAERLQCGESGCSAFAGGLGSVLVGMTVGGASLGLGTALFGRLLGGRGSVGWTFLGALGGLALTALLFTPLGFWSLVCIPIGAALGFELSSSRNEAEEEAEARVRVSVAPRWGGGGGVVGQLGVSF